MTEHDVEEREQVDARLLEVLLVERFGGRGETLRDAAPVVSPLRRPRGGLWLAAAAVLLGVGVVAAIALQDRTVAEPVGRPEQVMPPRFVTQDPVDAQVVMPKNYDEFRALLPDVQRLELLRYDTVGAHRLVSRVTVISKLDLVPWQERVVVEGERVDAWRKALQQLSVVPGEGGNGVGDNYRLVLGLSGGRELRCFFTWGERRELWVAENTPVRPGGDLQMMLMEAIADITRRHARAAGVVTGFDDFAKYASPVRFDLSAALLPQLPSKGSLRDLRVAGTPDVAGWQQVARLQQLDRFELVGANVGDVALTGVLAMPELRELRLRDCAGLDVAVLQRLAKMRRLSLLHLSNLPLGDDGAAFEALASLPMLREFGVRFSDVHAPADLLTPLQRTKLERLVLVDVPVDLDLAPLSQLPSLRELVVVGKLDEAALEPLRQMRSLRRLTLRNCKLTDDGAAALREALPDCALDWLPNQSWFDTGYAFDYAPK